MVLKVRHFAEDGSMLVRDNLLFALFVQAPLADIASGFKCAVERWLREVQQESIRWALVGESASELKPIGSTTIARCISRLQPKAPAKGDMTYFVLQGPEEDNPAFRVELLAHHTVPQTARGIRGSSFVEFRFPTEYLETRGIEGIVQLAAEMAAMVSYDSGYFAPAISWSYESDLYLARKIIGPLGVRHPGVDIHFNGSSCYAIDKRCRGPYWLTFLGRDLVAALGGGSALQTSFSPPITTQTVGDGILIRAGKEPEIGDVNRSQDVPLLRKVAHAIEPVTFFGDTAIKTYLFNDEDEKFERWDRRLLD